MLAPQMAMPIPPPIPPDVLEKAQRIVTQPSWEDISAIFRSKDRRNYKINVSTDAMEEEDDVEQKEQVLEFGKTIIEMLGQIIPAASQNPSLAPFGRELIMAVVKEFKAGRPLEEALEDGLNQIQNQPPQQAPNPEMIKAQAEMAKAQTDAQTAKIRMAIEQQKMQAEIADNQQARQFDAAKHQSDTEYKMADLQLTHQQKMAALENARLNTLLNLKKLGIDTRKQAMDEYVASGEGIDMEQRRQADIAHQQRQDALQAQDQHAQQVLQAHDQTNQHAIEHRKIDAQREATATQAATAAQAAAQKQPNPPA